MLDEIYHWIGLSVFWIGAFCGVCSIAFWGIGETIKYLGMWDTFLAASKYVQQQKRKARMENDR